MRDIPAFSGPMVDWPRVEAMDGALETLKYLGGSWQIALATNAIDSTESQIRNALHRAGLDVLIDRIYCTRNTGHAKPSPEFFRYILDDLRLHSSQVVMIGDSFENDVLGANRVGIFGIWLNPGTEGRTSLTYRTIHHLRMLPAALPSFDD